MARDKFRSAMMRQYSASLRMLIRRDNAKYSSARVRKYCASCTPDSGSLRSSTWVSKTLLNCPCDPVVERSCGSGMRCRLTSGSLGHAVKLNELKSVRFRTLEQIHQGIAIQTVNFYPATGQSGSRRSDSIRRPSPEARETGPSRSSRACAMSRSFGLGRSSLCVLPSSLVE